MLFKSSFKIGSKTISAESPTYVIAEVGSNYDGSYDEAVRYIHAAKEAGADAVKFQSFSAEGLFARKRPIGNDLKNAYETHPAFDIIKKFTLPDEWHAKLQKECERTGIEFLSAPFEIKKARMLKDMGCRALKIASGEMTHTDLLKEVGSYKIPIILSTGMAKLNEVQTALETLGRAGCDQVVILHCVGNYPPTFSEMNVRAVKTLGDTFNVPVGISDHTPGYTVPLLSLAMGGRCVEKHVTFDRKKSGPDHPYALEMPEFAAMIQELRNGEVALGTGVKEPCEREVIERTMARKGLYAAVALKAGEVITPQNTKWVRHAFGIPAEQSEIVYGLKLTTDRDADEVITWNDVKVKS